MVTTHLKRLALAFLSLGAFTTEGLGQTFICGTELIAIDVKNRTVSVADHSKKGPITQYTYPMTVHHLGYRWAGEPPKMRALNPSSLDLRTVVHKDKNWVDVAKAKKCAQPTFLKKGN